MWHRKWTIVLTKIRKCYWPCVSTTATLYICCRRVSARLFICHKSKLYLRLDVESRKQRHNRSRSRSCVLMLLPTTLVVQAGNQSDFLAQGVILVFWCERSWRNLDRVTPNGGAKYRCIGLKSAVFDQYLATFQKRCKRLWKANRNSYALYQKVLFPVTLSDPNYPQIAPFSIFCIPYLRNW